MIKRQVFAVVLLVAGVLLLVLSTRIRMLAYLAYGLLAAGFWTIARRNN
jgi:hypothetical protein